jgi:hypothetical protein
MGESTPRAVVCRGCAAEFMTCWPKQVFCTRKCLQDTHNAVNNANRKVVHQPRPCIVCGTTYLPQRVRPNGGMTCSRQCLARRNNRLRAGRNVQDNQPQACLWCDETFLPVRSDQNFCTQICWGHYRYSLVRVDTEPRDCLACAEVITNRGPQAQYCQPCIDRRRPMWQQARRAAKLDAFAENVDPNYLAKRDNWRCQLCRNAVNKGLKWPDPLSASIDHVIPISLGGEHSYANTQLAHLVCNIRKGNRITEPQQLALIG